MKLSIKNLKKSYSGVLATDNISLCVENNSIHALIGPNGAGKTSLIKQISGEIKSDAGSICLNDIEITNMLEYKRARLGLVRTFQVSSLIFGMNVFEHIVLALQTKSNDYMTFTNNIYSDGEIFAQSNKILEKYKLLKYFNDKVENLSHGVKRQLELAMALIQEPKLLVLDEPTAGMGIEETIGFISDIKEIKGNFTILLVEHDMDVVFGLADIISVLDMGRVIATDEPNIIVNNEEVKKIYLGT